MTLPDLIAAIPALLEKHVVLSALRIKDLTGTAEYQTVRPALAHLIDAGVIEARGTAASLNLKGWKGNAILYTLTSATIPATLKRTLGQTENTQERGPYALATRRDIRGYMWSSGRLF